MLKHILKFKYKYQSLKIRLKSPIWMRNSSFKTIFIDITGACNARCPYCLKGSGAQSSGGFMSVGTFEKIFKYLKSNKELVNAICLFNWGEPSLHPEINKILRTVGKYGRRAFLSSNLIYLPDYDKKALACMNGMDISLSGFSQSSYGYIHGGQLDKVLKNIDVLLKMLEGAGCPWRPSVRWHRYRFNEVERDAAARYFQSRGIKFYAVTAHLNDMIRTMRVFDNELELPEIRQIEKDLFMDYWKEVRRRTNDCHRCLIWPWLVIDENANILLCCGFSNEVKENNLGSIFNIALKDIIKIKKSSLLCKRCLSYGLPGFSSVVEDFTLDDFLSEQNKKICKEKNKL